MREVIPLRLARLVCCARQGVFFFVVYSGLLQEGMHGVACMNLISGFRHAAPRRVAQLEYA